MTLYIPCFLEACIISKEGRWPGGGLHRVGGGMLRLREVCHRVSGICREQPRVFRGCCRVLCILGAANVAAHASELPMIEFSLKPRLCVLSSDEETCFDELEIRWRAKQNLSLCLYQSEFEKPLACWTDVDHGAHRFLLSTSEDVNFYLREQSLGLEISEAFEVIHDNKRYRRPRRNPWSFF